MSNNIFLNPTVYTRGTLVNLGGFLNTAGLMNLDYADEFGMKAQKIGATFNVRKPQRFEGTENSQYTPESLNNLSTPITVDQRSNVHFDWGSVEKTLSIDAANDKYFKPAAMRIAHSINYKAARWVALNSFNIVGTPGVIPGSGTLTVPQLLGVYLGAKGKLVAQGLPEDERLACIINIAMSNAFVGNVPALFNPAGEGGAISKQWKSGQVDPTNLGFIWKIDQACYVHTTGIIGTATGLVNGVNQQSDDGNNSSGTLITDTWQATSTEKLKIGDWFTIAGVYAVHPQYKTSTGDLMQFRVNASGVDAAGALTISFFPAITPTGQYRNVDSVPADNAEILPCNGPTGNADLYALTVTPFGMVMAKDAFAFCPVKLEGPEDGMGAIVTQERDDDTKIWIRTTRSWDGNLEQEIFRLDTLFGFGNLYRELACLICSGPNS